PGMNFASAKVRDGNVEVSGRTFRLTGRERHAAAQGADREVLIGFRPEDLQLDGEGHSGEIRISARIEAVEYLGREELLRGRAIGERIVALVPSGTNVRVGDDVHFAVPPEKLHLFDPYTKQSLAALSVDEHGVGGQHEEGHVGGPPAPSGCGGPRARLRAVTVVLAEPALGGGLPARGAAARPRAGAAGVPGGREGVHRRRQAE